MSSTLTAKLDRSVTLDGVTYTNPNQTTGIEHTVSKVMSFRVTVSASSTKDVIDLTDTSFPDAFPDAFKYLEITCLAGESGADKHFVEFGTDKGGDNGAEYYTVELPVNGFVVLQGDGSYANYTADFGVGGTVDVVESVRLRNDSATNQATFNVFIAG